MVSSRAVSIGELMEEINRRNERVIFLGDGVPVFREAIEKGMTAAYSFAPAHLNRQRASAVCALGAVYFREGKITDADSFAPEYLRQSQAEREKSERGNH